MKFSIESLDECIAEIVPLLRVHYAEVSFVHQNRDAPIPLDLDIDAYRSLETAGILRGYTARKDGELIGYAAFVVSPSNLHHKGLRYASLDVLSVVPKWRGLTGSRLMAYAERQLKSEGVQMVTIAVPKVCDWTPLAERWGYEPVETYMQKWIE